MNALYQEIETIRHKPGMYIGSASITVLDAHLGGFQSAMRLFGKFEPKTLFPLPFWYFHEFVANHYGWFGATAGWKNIIRVFVHGQRGRSAKAGAQNIQKPGGG